MPVYRAFLMRIACALLAACASVSGTGQIDGVVLLGAPCGTMALAPHANRCETRRIATRIAVIGADDRKLAAIETDSDGRFSLQLPPGRYELRALDRPGYASAATMIEVREGERTSAELVYPSLAP
jgi:hypothetical protein